MPAMTRSAERTRSLAQIERAVPDCNRCPELRSYCADVGRIAFFAILSVTSFKLAGKTKQMMVSIDFPKSAMYYLVGVCLVAMAIRSIQVLVRHIRQGGSRISLEHARHVEKS